MHRLEIVFREYRNLILGFFAAEISLSIVLLKITPHIFFEVLPYIGLLTVIFLAYLPILGYLKIKYEVEKNFPFFIAFLYSISFVTSNRRRFFEVASEAKEFGYLSKVMRRILELATKLRLGYAEATKCVQKVVPESNLRSFLDRFSSALESGEEITEFLDREFKISLDVYETTYKKSLENIRLLQEMAVAFMSSLAFTLVVITIIPFLIGISMSKMITYFVIIAVAVNLLVFALSKYLLVEDKLLHNLPEKPKEYQKLLTLFSLFFELH
jgi:flagellar protein FlaJ